MMNTKRNADAIRQLMRSPVWADDGAVKLVSLLPGHGKPQSILLARAAAPAGRYAPVRTESGKSALLVQGQAAPPHADAGSAGHGYDPVNP